MATVMEHQNIPRFRTSDQLCKVRANVGAGGLHPRWIGVQKNEDVGLSKPKPSDKGLVHALHIVGTALKLHFRARVVAPNQQCSLRHASPQSVPKTGQIRLLSTTFSEIWTNAVYHLELQILK